MVFCCAGAWQVGAQGAEVRFPTIETQDLNEQMIIFPDDFSSGGTLLVMAFKRELADKLKLWQERVEALLADYPTLPWYQIPVIDDPGVVVRGFIFGGMKLGMPSELRANTAILFPDTTWFKQSLRIFNEDVVHGMLVDNRGTVLWRHSGPPTDMAWRRLESVLDR